MTEHIEHIEEFYRCSECKERIDPDTDCEFIDFGIGPYEFWGARGNDSCIQFVTKCCESHTIDQVVQVNGEDDTVNEIDTAFFAPDGEY